MATKKEMATKKGLQQKQRSKAKALCRQVVLTLDGTTGEVVKVETLGPAGKRHALSGAEITKLLSNDELSELNEVLEDAYTAGIRDGMDDAFWNPGIGNRPNSGKTESGLETAGSQMLRSGIRRFILRRALRHGAVRSHVHTPGNGVHDVP